MSSQDIIRAWKDASYRSSLSEDELALLPAHPAGAVELNSSELEQVKGGADPEVAFETFHPICPCSFARA